MTSSCPGRKAHELSDFDGYVGDALGMTEGPRRFSIDGASQRQKRVPLDMFKLREKLGIGESDRDLIRQVFRVFLVFQGPDRGGGMSKNEHCG